MIPRMVILAHCISIHALREEGDVLRVAIIVQVGRFLSTPSARRATWIAAIALTNFLFLSTPSARRATYQHPR